MRGNIYRIVGALSDNIGYLCGCGFVPTIVNKGSILVFQQLRVVYGSWRLDIYTAKATLSMPTYNKQKQCIVSMHTAHFFPTFESDQST